MQIITVHIYGYGFLTRKNITPKVIKQFWEPKNFDYIFFKNYNFKFIEEILSGLIRRHQVKIKP